MFSHKSSDDDCADNESSSQGTFKLLAFLNGVLAVAAIGVFCIMPCNKAYAASSDAQDHVVNAKILDEAIFNQTNHFGKGQLNTAYAQYFIGDSYLNPLTDSTSSIAIANVTFEPGCRNNWHIHHASTGGGQILICTAGEGWYQEEGKDAISLHPGMVINIPANVKHWHGAKKDSWFAHLALAVPGEQSSNEWLEPVSDEEYNKL